jgi:8-oxo-dGTP diphosphatase
MPAGADPRAVARARVLAIRPSDEKEAADLAETLRWIDSGAPLYRTDGPGSPARHLVVYFALLDDASRSLLLIHHVKAQMWLLPGGHVDDCEDPRRSAEREAQEELGIHAQFHPLLAAGEALFLSITPTGRDPVHVDVTLWFVLASARQAALRPDPREITAIRWTGLDDEAGWTADCYDPQMGRFTRKLATALGPTAPASDRPGRATGPRLRD